MKHALKLLFVEDEPEILKGLADFFKNDDRFEISTASDHLEAIQAIDRKHNARECYDAIVLDHILNRSSFSDMSVNGPAVVRHLLEKQEESKVLVYTSYGADSVKSSYPEGRVCDFIDKSQGPSHLKNMVNVALMNIIRTKEDQNHKSRANNDTQKTKQKSIPNSRTKIIGRSKLITDMVSQIEKYALYPDEPVLILGENGTGKELVARMVHELTYPNTFISKNMIDVNCAALPRELIVRELFGHMKGSFTGADKDEPGKFELAKDSTLFLDEIGELPLDSQSSLLRAVQERVITRLGGKINIPVDARFVFATNNNLTARVADRSFREDLYHRISTCIIKVPPLKDRKEDIPLLMDFIVDQFVKKNNLALTPEFDDDAMSAFVSYDWPGNIRQLQNAVKRAIILSHQTMLVNLEIASIAIMP